MSDPAPYLRIKDTIRERVRAGVWEPGDPIPGEAAMADDFGCARATVHRALRELAEEGVLERKRKSGTRVALPKGRVVELAIPLIDQEIRDTGAVYAYRLLSREVAPMPPPIAAALDRASGDTALHLRCLHFADDRPFQYEDRWINTEIVPEALSEPFDAEGPNGWLVRHVPWTDAEHMIHADGASPDVSRALDLPPSDPVLVIARRTWNDRGPVTTVRFHHPGRTYKLRTAFARG
jgi:GntR family histidine utilization transcriptional repressor